MLDNLTSAKAVLIWDHKPLTINYLNSYFKNKSYNSIHFDEWRSAKPPPTDKPPTTVTPTTDQAPPTTYLKSNRPPTKGTIDHRSENPPTNGCEKTDHRPDYGLPRMERYAHFSGPIFVYEIH